MRVEATLTVPGPVSEYDGETGPPLNEVCILHPDSLYIGGVRVGKVLLLRPVGQMEYVTGDPVPTGFVVAETYVDCILEIG